MKWLTSARAANPSLLIRIGRGERTPSEVLVQVTSRVNGALQLLINRYGYIRCGIRANPNPIRCGVTLNPSGT